MLFYKHDIVTDSIGIIFCIDGAWIDGKTKAARLATDLMDPESDNAIIPSRNMLQKALKLDKVHVYAHLSRSQV